MPKSPVFEAGHGVVTDHAIRIHRSSPDSLPTHDLTAFLSTADDRSLGLAYAELGDPRARDLLVRAKPADAEVRLRLAALETDESRASALYESVLRANPFQPVALVNLGSLYAKAGNLEQAASLWERALAANPAIEEAVFNLAQIRSPAEAREIIKRYLLFNPGSLAARRWLDARPAP
jgi:tetratricopeptide (TPR) repeat protein